MLHPKMILNITGKLLLIEAAFILLCVPFSLYYRSEGDLMPLLYSVGVACAAGILLAALGRSRDKSVSRRDGYVVVALCWVAFSFVGALPYWLSGYVPSYTDAFFETISGFTTTGTSVLNNIEELPHSLLFWRSLTQWIGGLGIVIFTIAILPVFGGGDVFLFAAEATGPLQGKLHPRITVTARWIFTVYLGIVVLETLCLRFAGMGLFDALCHAMTTAATGGYSTRQASIAAFNSPLIEYIVAFFMFVAGTNFTLLYYSLFRGELDKLFEDVEFRTYAGIVMAATLFVAATLFCTTPMNEEQSLRYALFQVISVQTTTGYASADFMQWTPLLWLVMSFLMIPGACAGSTSGAVKCVRIALLWRIIANEFRRIMHPSAVIPLRMGKVTISSPIRLAVLAFAMLYMVTILFCWLVYMLFGLSFMEAYSVSVSCVGNVGPGLGCYGPAFSWSEMPDLLKWFSGFVMLAGRLELFTILMILSPAFWKNRN